MTVLITAVCISFAIESYSCCCGLHLWSTFLSLERYVSPSIVYYVKLSVFFCKVFSKCIYCILLFVVIQSNRTQRYVDSLFMHLKQLHILHSIISMEAVQYTPTCYLLASLVEVYILGMLILKRGRSCLWFSV